MREVKFRAWRTSKKFMSPSFTVLEWIELGISCGKFEDPDEVLWMQYTGLKDKNSVEIYEGDILSGKSKIFGYTNGVVEMCEYNDNEEYMHECHLGWNVCGIPLADLVNDGLAVIGNAHENPELLD